jgi:dethiobiotin synthetase
MAPPMAAAVLGRPPFTIRDLAAELTWPAPEPDVRWVETAGGVRSPLASDGADTVDLCRLLQPDVVALVADAGLGTINAVRLCSAALSGQPVVVVLNRCTGDLAARNRAWLADVDGFDVVTDPVTLAERLLGG